MLETSKELKMVTDKLMEICVKEMVTRENIENMSVSDFELAQNVMKLIQLSSQVTLELTTEIDSINKKIDMLLERKES